MKEQLSFIQYFGSPLVPGTVSEAPGATAVRATKSLLLGEPPFQKGAEKCERNKEVRGGVGDGLYQTE